MKQGSKAAFNWKSENKEEQMTYSSYDRLEVSEFRQTMKKWEETLRWSFHHPQINTKRKEETKLKQSEHSKTGRKSETKEQI